MQSSQSVLDRLRERIASAPPEKVFPPATSEVAAQSESLLRFPLNSFLREVYLTVANGGFGPAYGLAGLPGGATDDQGFSIVENYQNFSSHFRSDWPEKLVPICHLGCGIVSCVDCSIERGPITTWHPALPSDDKSLWRRNFEPEADSIVDWFAAWLERSNGFIGS